VHDARRTGATVVALDQGDCDLEQLAHEALAVPSACSPLSFEAAQHLVSVAAGETGDGRRRTPREWLARLLDAVSGPTGD
jgi:hypothetical protein